MTFAEPVETLNAHSTALRKWEPQAPKDLKPVLIEAADALDDLHKQNQDLIDSQRLVKGLLQEWSVKLEASTNIRIGQMDSASRAAEKTAEGQRSVLDVVRQMRELL